MSHVGCVKTTYKLFDGINRKDYVVFPDPVSPQITGEATTRHISNTVVALWSVQYQSGTDWKLKVGFNAAIHYVAISTQYKQLS